MCIHTHVYTYSCVCIHMCMYTHVYTYTCVCIHMCMYTHVYVYTCVCIHMSMYTPVYVCMCMYVYVYVYMCMYTCVCRHPCKFLWRKRVWPTCVVKQQGRPPKVWVGGDINCIFPQSWVKIPVTWDTRGTCPTFLSIRSTNWFKFCSTLMYKNPGPD